jgi:hypothetical protein
MLCIDWYRLNWYTISAWIFAILLGIYVTTKLKNFFFRWSNSPPNFLQPFAIHKETRVQERYKQSVLVVEQQNNNLDTILIWVIGKCPRFLLNLAWSLCLHAKSVCVNEVKRGSHSPVHLDSSAAVECEIFYSKADQLGMNRSMPFQNKTILLHPPTPTENRGLPRTNTHLILGKQLRQVDIQVLEKEGCHVVNLHGGKKFRGSELALLAELITILKEKQKGLG